MSAKYKLILNETKVVNGTTLYRIEALRDFYHVKKGDKGGWIEKEDNLSHEGECWVFGEACVYDNAQVLHDAGVFNDACVFDNARVYDRACVFDNARVYHEAQVFGNVWILDDAKVFGNTKISKN